MVLPSVNGRKVSIPQAVFTCCNSQLVMKLSTRTVSFNTASGIYVLQQRNGWMVCWKRIVSIPQAVFTCCNFLASSVFLTMLIRLFQYRKRYLRVATEKLFWKNNKALMKGFNTASGIYVLQRKYRSQLATAEIKVSIPQAVFTCCNHTLVILRVKGSAFQYRKRYLRVATWKKKLKQR